MDEKKKDSSPRARSGARVIEGTTGGKSTKRRGLTAFQRYAKSSGYKPVVLSGFGGFAGGSRSTPSASSESNKVNEDTIYLRKKEMERSAKDAATKADTAKRAKEMERSAKAAAKPAAKRARLPR